MVATKTGFGGPGGVTVVSTATWLVVARIPVFDSSPNWVDFSPDGHYCYVNNSQTNTVARIDMSNASPALWTVNGLLGNGTSRRIRSA